MVSDTQKPMKDLTSSKFVILSKTIKILNKGLYLLRILNGKYVFLKRYRPTVGSLTIMLLNHTSHGLL